MSAGLCPREAPQASGRAPSLSQLLVAAFPPGWSTSLSVEGPLAPPPGPTPMPSRQPDDLCEDLFPYNVTF